VRAGIRDAVDAGAEIVVLSLGGRRTEHVQSAVEYAHEEGVLVLASAGNRGPDVGTMNYPAADALVVAVGAVGERRSGERIVPADFRVPDFSSRGRDGRSFERADGYLEFAAPGVGVQSTWPGGYATRSGTSLAVPHVAGLAAKLWQGTTDRDGDGHRHEDVRRALQRRAPEFDVTEGEHAREGYDPAAGLGLPQLRPPRARFDLTPPVPTEGRTATFSGAGSTSPDGTVVGYEWDFDGDGATDARGRAVSHTFGTVGPHAVTLRVTDDGGATNATTRSVLVNDRPNVSVAVPPDATAGAPVTLAATVADEVGATTVTWSFPDGTSATGTTVTRTFEPGRQVIAVTAEDEYGARTTREITLTVGAAPGTTATPSDEPPPRTGDGTGTRTTAGSGPGFGWGTVLASGVLALLAVGRRGSVGP
jgi:PKD repeat protein